MIIQFTLYCTTGEYKPISTTVDVPIEDYEQLQAQDVGKLRYWHERAISRICAQRYKTVDDLMNHNYKTLKMRIYDPEERRNYNKKKLIQKMADRKKKENS